MFGAMKEYDELAMLEEIQKELISQGTKLESHSNSYCYEIGDVSSGNGSRSDFFGFIVCQSFPSLRNTRGTSSLRSSTSRPS